MNTVTVSPKFQVVIPLAVREKLKLVAGQKVQTVVYDNRLELIPRQPLKKMKGFLRGINTDVHRDKDRI